MSYTPPPVVPSRHCETVERNVGLCIPGPARLSHTLRLAANRRNVAVTIATNGSALPGPNVIRTPSTVQVQRLLHTITGDSDFIFNVQNLTTLLMYIIKFFQASGKYVGGVLLIILRLRDDLDSAQLYNTVCSTAPSVELRYPAVH